MEILPFLNVYDTHTTEKEPRQGAPTLMRKRLLLIWPLFPEKCMKILVERERELASLRPLDPLTQKELTFRWCYISSFGQLFCHVNGFDHGCFCFKESLPRLGLLLLSKFYSYVLKVQYNLVCEYIKIYAKIVSDYLS